jgi:hypothetical protein
MALSRLVEKKTFEKLHLTGRTIKLRMTFNNSKIVMSITEKSVSLSTALYVLTNVIPYFPLVCSDSLAMLLHFFNLNYVPILVASIRSAVRSLILFTY